MSQGLKPTLLVDYIIHTYELGDPNPQTIGPAVYSGRGFGKLRKTFWGPPHMVLKSLSWWKLVHEDNWSTQVETAARSYLLVRPKSLNITHKITRDGM